MQDINLVNEWRAIIRDDADFDVSNLDVSDWETVSLPLNRHIIDTLKIPKKIWLQREFIMPMNEECSTWWLESNIALSGRVWLNGDEVENLDEGDIYQLEITNYIALDENVLIFCLEPTHDLAHWRELVCVPYPCA